MAENMMEELVRRISAAVEPIIPDYEIVLVNDCSPDKSWRVIQSLCANDKRVKAISLSRNFGQHYAITAGLSKARGEWVVVMDCDLQDRPEEIPRLYNKAIEGFDCVFAQRTQRHDIWIKKMSGAIFYRIFSFFVGVRHDRSIANFGIYHRQVVNAVLSMGDSIRFFPVMVQWVGFRQASLPVEHAERLNGKSSYSWRSLLRLAENNLVAFSNRPLKWMLKTGFVVTILSLLIAALYFLNWAFGNIKVDGFTTLVISVWFALGVLAMMIGVLGIYIGNIYDKVKDRPIYIISETINLDEE